MLNLLPYRVSVVLDQGKTNIGKIVDHNLRSHPFLFEYPEPANPGDPKPSPIFHDHVIFIENMTSMVTVGGIDYYGMHVSAIVGYIT